MTVFVEQNLGLRICFLLNLICGQQQSFVSRSTFNETAKKLIFEVDNFFLCWFVNQSFAKKILSLNFQTQSSEMLYFF